MSMGELTTDVLYGLVAWVYLLTNGARVVAYVPQIHAVWRCADGAASISLLSWGTWTLSHIAALLYGLLVLHDVPFVLVTSLHLAGCGTVTWIALRRRYPRRAVLSMPSVRSSASPDTLVEKQ